MLYFNFFFRLVNDKRFPDIFPSLSFDLLFGRQPCTWFKSRGTRLSQRNYTRVITSCTWKCTVYAWFLLRNLIFKSRRSSRGEIASTVDILLTFLSKLEANENLVATERKRVVILALQFFLMVIARSFEFPEIGWTCSGSDVYINPFPLKIVRGISTCDKCKVQ